MFSYVRSRLAEQVIRRLNTVELCQHVCVEVTRHWKREIHAPAKLNFKVMEVRT